MQWTQQLSRIAERLRDITTDDPAAADLYYRRLTGQAAALLSQHWPSDGSLPEFPHPKLTPELQADTQAREAVWHLTFVALSELLRRSFPGEIPFAGSPRPEAAERSSAGVLVFTAFEHPDDWRERSRDAADVLDWLADRMAEPHSESRKRSERVEQLEQLEIVLPTDPALIDVHNALVAMPEADRNLSQVCRKVAEEQGLKAGSLRTAYNRWKRQNKPK
jgi:hypothetical protein